MAFFSTTRAPLAEYGGGRRKSKLTMWTELVLFRGRLQVQHVSFCLPRFHLLGLIWTMIELVIFVIALAQTDFSFNSLDTTSQILKARAANQNLFGASEGWGGESSSLTMESTLLSLTGGGTGGSQSSDYCGPLPGTPLFNFINSQALRALAKHNRRRASSTGQQAVILSQAGEATSNNQRLGIFELHASLKSRLIDALLCNHTGPIIDQRFIISQTSQICQDLRTIEMANMTDLFGFCRDKEPYFYRMEVLGINSVTALIFRGGASTDSYDDPITEWVFFNVRLGASDFDREEMQWLIRRLVPVWDRIKASAVVWIFLSIAMRVAYWMTVVEVTKRSVMHLNSECPAFLEELSDRSPEKNAHNHGAKKRLQKVAGATTGAGAVGAMKEEESEEQAIKEDQPMLRKRATFKEFLTAASIGIACANNDWLYLGIAVVRQIVGAVYGEILTAGAVTTTLALWQAFSIVIYNQAIVRLIFTGLEQLFRRKEAVRGIADVGVLGYISFLLFGAATQTNQLLAFDLLRFYTVTNSALSTFNWLAFPTCGIDGPCMHLRGDTIMHLVASLYVSIMVLFVSGLLFIWRKRRRNKALASINPASIKVQSSQAPSDPSHTSPYNVATDEDNTSWISLGIVGCPHCGQSIIKQTTLTTSLAYNTPSTLKNMSGGANPQRSENNKEQFQGKQASPPTKIEDTDSDKPRDERGSCCLWRQCLHRVPEPKTQTGDDVHPVVVVSRYRFMTL